MDNIHTDIKGLYRRIYAARQLLKKTNNIDEKIALRMYIDTIYGSIEEVADKRLCIHANDIYGKCKNLKRINDKYFAYENEMINNFIKNKEFISDYYGKIARGVNKLHIEDDSLYGDNYKTLKIEDYFDIFNLFMKSIYLDDFYEEFYKKGILKFIIERQINYGRRLPNPLPSQETL